MWGPKDSRGWRVYSAYWVGLILLLMRSEVPLQMILILNVIDSISECLVYKRVLFLVYSCIPLPDTQQTAHL